MKKLFFVPLVILLLALAFLSGSEAIAGTYTTDFPLTENSISESGNWVNGGTTGLDWHDVQTTGGNATGTSAPVRYSDPTAILTGTWGLNQTAEATVYSVNQTASYYQEVEIRLRSSLSGHSSTGYEVFFRCLKTSETYASIVRWNGSLGDFTVLAHNVGSQYGVANGDVVKATIIGNVIKGYINGVEVLSVTDNTYTTGNPGIGFNANVGSTNGDFGFTKFAASDDVEAPFPPKNLRILP